MPGTSDAIQAAAHHGYEAVVLVVIFFGIIGILSWLGRTVLTQAAERESRLSSRVTDLEKFIRDELLNQLKESTKSHLTVSVAMGEVASKMVSLDETMCRTRPCLWSIEKQEELLHQAAERLAEQLVSLVSQKVDGILQP